MNTKQPLRILCVDDHSFLIDGLRARFELERDLECVGSLPDASRLVPEAKEKMAALPLSARKRAELSRMVPVP